MKNRPTIKTDRLLLRPFELSDAPQVKELAGDKAISDTTLNIPYPYEDGMAEEWISTHQPKFEAEERVDCAIVLKSTQELIGAIGLIIDKKFNRADLGYWVAKEYWNHGYCTEAARAILDYAFDKLKLHKITAIHIARNPASGKVMEKIGMKKEGLFKDHVIKCDEYEDIVSYGILNGEFT
ncbi:MAG: GNAT family N-acetyltransferase [Spirochaetes bacterium]|nr:GNAT family N-acetyltransferase [Spirochaetota bacterium]